MCPGQECYIVEVGCSYEINGERMFKRNEYIPYNTIPNYCITHNWTGAFSTVYRYSNVNQDKSNLYGCFYLDFDDAKNFENVRQDVNLALSYLETVFRIMPENVRLYYSGNKGIHLMVPPECFNLKPTAFLNGIWKEIAMAISALSTYKTIDLRIYDNKRLFRIPNTIHEVSGRRKIQLTHEQVLHMDVDDIKKLAMSSGRLWQAKPLKDTRMAEKSYITFAKRFLENAEKEKKRAAAGHKTTLTFTPPCVQHLLNNGIEEGARNVAISCLTVYAKNCGMSIDEAENFIIEWNGRNSKPIGHGEIHKTVRSMYKSSKNYGCTTLKSVSICVPEMCKLYKKK